MILLSETITHEPTLQSTIDRATRYIEQQRAQFGEIMYADYTMPIRTEEQEQTQTITDSIHSDLSYSPETEQKLEQEIMPTTPVSPAWQASENLAVLNQNICACMNCRLGETRTKFVFGVGNPNATLMVIGEAPGADEDAQGEPFVGRGGQLLTKMLEAVQFYRHEVFIANIIKCRPPGNRRPMADEVEQCEPYLHKQIELVQPKIMLALGLTAVNTLMKSDFKMGDIRGKQLEYRGIPLITTYHPAALLRNPEWKKPAWEDVQLLRKLHDELVNA
jgi:uracil-DNA glycosylase